jgi:hypothetical protein
MSTTQEGPGAQSFVRRSGRKVQVVRTDERGITFASFQDRPDLDVADPASLESASERALIAWVDVRRVQKSGSRAIHVQASDGTEHFATWNAEEIWDQIRAHVPELQPGKVAAPTEGRGWWLKLGCGVGALGGVISGVTFWLSGAESLWEAPHRRVKLVELALMWLLRALAWIGPWPWVVLTALAVGFALLGALKPAAGLPDDDVLVRE